MVLDALIRDKAAYAALPAYLEVLNRQGRNTEPLAIERDFLWPTAGRTAAMTLQRREVGRLDCRPVEGLMAGSRLCTIPGWNGMVRPHGATLSSAANPCCRLSNFAWV